MAQLTRQRHSYLHYVHAGGEASVAFNVRGPPGNRVLSRSGQVKDGNPWSPHRARVMAAAPVRSNQ